jgi:hypothetical protein
MRCLYCTLLRFNEYFLKLRYLGGMHLPILRNEMLTELARAGPGSAAVGNLHVALKSRVLLPNKVDEWAARVVELINNHGKLPYDAAVGAVLETPDAYQRLGSIIQNPIENLIVFARATKIERALDDQASRHPDLLEIPRAAPKELCEFLLEKAKLKRDFFVFNERYPVWYSIRENILEFHLNLINTGDGSHDTEASNYSEALLRFMGLPLLPSQEWLALEFEQSDETSLRQPTAFDGIDGVFFKQLVIEHDREFWGRTIDLQQLITDDGIYLEDGGFEAIGRSPRISQLVRCWALPVISKLAHSDNTLIHAYATGLLSAIVGERSWAEVAAQIETVL